MYRLRVDQVADLNIDTLIQTCRPDTYVIVRHELPTGNPHYHAYFKYNGDMKENTLRQRFKRNFTYLKSTDYSIKKCDAERANEYIQYMFNTKHGNKWELIITNDFDDQLLNDLIQNAKQISDDYAESKNKPKSKSPTIWDLAVEVEERFKQEYLTVNNLGDEVLINDQIQVRVEIYTNITIQVLRKHHKGFDEFLLRKVITTAMTSTAKGREIMRRKMLDSFCWFRT